MNEINYPSNHPIDFKAEYTEAEAKSLRQFKLLCLSNPIGWAVGVLYLTNHIFKKAVLLLAAEPLFGTSTMRRERSQISLDRLTKQLGGKELKLRTPDGRNLEAMHFEGSSNKTVLLFTGSHQSYEHQACPMVAAYKKKGFNVLCINYGGFGKSEGSPSQEGVELDAETAYQYIQKKYPDHEIHAHGYSLGSYPATYLAKNHPLKKIVVDRGFGKFSNVAKDHATEKAGKIAGSIFKGIVDYAMPLDNTKGISNISSDILYARAVWDDTMLSYHEDAFKTYSSKTEFLAVDDYHEHNSQFVWFQQHPEFWNWINKSNQ